MLHFKKKLWQVASEKASTRYFTSLSAIRLLKLATGEEVQRNASKPESMALDIKVIFPALANWKRMTVHELFKVWRQCHTKNDYKAALWTMNEFLNYGRDISHPQVAQYLLHLAMHCQQPQEAIQLIHLYHTWLKHPPPTSSILSLMRYLETTQDVINARGILEAVRENWQLDVKIDLYESYIRTLKASQSLNKESLYREVKVILQDASKNAQLICSQWMLSEFVNLSTELFVCDEIKEEEHIDDVSFYLKSLQQEFIHHKRAMSPEIYLTNLNFLWSLDEKFDGKLFCEIFQANINNSLLQYLLIEGSNTSNIKSIKNNLNQLLWRHGDSDIETRGLIKASPIIKKICNANKDQSLQQLLDSFRLA